MALLKALEQKLCEDREAVLKLLEARHRSLLQNLEDKFMIGSSSKIESLEMHDNPQPNLVSFSKAREESETRVRLPSEALGVDGKKLLEKLPSNCSAKSVVSIAKVEKESDEKKDVKSLKHHMHSIRSTIQSDGTEDMHGFFHRQCEKIRSLRELAESELFEIIFAALIFVNTLIMCVEAHYWGFDTDYETGYSHGCEPGSDVWPGADLAFKILDYFFGILFTIEVIIKALGLRCGFFKTWWSLLDVLIVVSWIINAILADLPLNPMTLRVIRLLRLVRILRLVRTFQIFDVLNLMVVSLSASRSVLLWSTVLLFAIMMSSALVMVNVMEMYITDEQQPKDKRLEAFRYFGNFSRAILSMFEITLGNFTPITRFLHENVTEWFAVIIMAYHCIVSFAVVTVIRAIFIHDTFQAASNDNELMILRQRRTKARTISKMSAFFHEADDSGDGFLSHGEFIQVLESDRVKAWLAAMGLEVRDAEMIFQMVDDGDHRISAQEFVEGFAVLKGAARSIDMVQVLGYVRNVSSMLRDHIANIGSAGTPVPAHPLGGLNLKLLL